MPLTEPERFDIKRVWNDLELEERVVVGADKSAKANVYEILKRLVETNCHWGSHDPLAMHAADFKYTQIYNLVANKTRPRFKSKPKTPKNVTDSTFSPGPEEAKDDEPMNGSTEAQGSSGKKTPTLGAFVNFTSP